MNRPTQLLEDAKKYTLPYKGMYEAPEHPIPSLMDGDMAILPPEKVPLPLGGRGPVLGENGEDEWEIAATKILVPRWAAECIQKRLVFGQELREGESLKARVEAIIQTPGEMDKWKRILKWGLAIVRQMDLEMAKRWSGGLIELLDFEVASDMPRLLRFAFSKGWALFISLVYWDAWSQACWDLASTSQPEGWSASDRERAARLLEEGQSIWSHTWMPWEYPTEELPPCQDSPRYEGPFSTEQYDDPYYFKDDVHSGDTLQLVFRGLQALQSLQAGERGDRGRILMQFLPHWAFIHTLAVAESERLQGILREEFIRAETGAELENVKAQIAELQNDYEQAQQHKANESDKRIEANQLRTLLEAIGHFPTFEEETKRQIIGLAEQIAQNTVATAANTAATNASVKNTEHLAKTLEAERESRLKMVIDAATHFQRLPKIYQDLAHIWAENPGISQKMAGKMLSSPKSKGWVSKLWKKHFPGVPWAGHSKGREFYNSNKLEHNPQR